MGHDDVAKRLRLIAESAAGLRAAGVTSLEIDGDRIAVRYAPPYGPADEPVIASIDKPPVVAVDDEPETDPLDDPDTYGGEVPGFDLDEESE